MVSKVMDLCYFGVVAQVIRHERRVSVSFFSMRMLSAAAHIDSRTQASRSANVLARGY